MDPMIAQFITSFLASAGFALVKGLKSNIFSPSNSKLAYNCIYSAIQDARSHITTAEFNPDEMIKLLSDSIPIEVTPDQHLAPIIWPSDIASRINSLNAFQQMPIESRNDFTRKFCEQFYLSLFERISKKQYLVNHILLFSSQETIRLLENIANSGTISKRTSRALLSAIQEPKYLRKIDHSFLYGRQGRHQPKAFFEGMTSWTNVLAGLCITRTIRCGKETFSTSEMVQQIHNTSHESGIKVWNILAPAGEGKTTLLYDLAIRLSKGVASNGSDKQLLIYYAEDKLTIEDIRLVLTNDGLPVVLLVDITDAKSTLLSLRSILGHLALNDEVITFVIAGRLSEWDPNRLRQHLPKHKVSFFNCQLCKPSDKELKALVSKLTEHGCLGCIAEQPTLEAQLKYVKQSSSGWLLVMLLEATHGKTLQDIVRSEYDNLNSDLQVLYACASILQALCKGLPLWLAENYAGELQSSSLPSGVLFIEMNTIHDEEFVVCRHRIIAQELASQLLTDQSANGALKSLNDTIDPEDISLRQSYLSILRSLLFDSRGDGQDKSLYSLRRRLYNSLRAQDWESRLWRFCMASLNLMKRSDLEEETIRWGEILRGVGKWGLRLELVQSMLILHPNNPVLHFLAGQAMYRNAKIKGSNIPYDDILGYMKRSEQLGNKHERFISFYCVTEAKSGELYSALTRILGAIQTFPNSDEIQLSFDQILKIIVREEKGGVHALCLMLERAIAEIGDTPKSLYILAKAHLQDKQADKALEVCNKLVINNPSNHDYRGFLATCIADATGDLIRAIRELETVIKSYPNQDRHLAMYLNNIALWKLQIDPKNRESESLWLRACKLNVTFPWPYLLYGEHLLKCGRHEEGLRSIIEGESIAEKIDDPKALAKASAVRQQYSLEKA